MLKRAVDRATLPLDSRLTRDLLAHVLTESIREQRRARRWGIFWKFLIAGYATFTLALTASTLSLFSASAQGPHAALVDIQGPIESTGPNSELRLNRALRQAFEAPQSRAVIVRINSPGGSPVQAGRIHDEIVRLKQRHPDKPVYAVAGDTMASGAYYIAAAADIILADRASLVGSIGVVMESVGLDQAMDRMGVERRIYTAGEHKGFLDPFAPEDSADVEHLKSMLAQIHAQFIAAVQTGRSDRLNGDPERLFSGLIWTGAQALELGLVDGLGGHERALQELGLRDAVTYTQRPPMDLIQSFLASAAETLAATLAARLHGADPLTMR